MFPSEVSEGLSAHDVVVLEGIANGITDWYLIKNPMRVFGTEPDKVDLDWLLDRLTKELAQRINGFDSKAFVEHVWRECGLL